MQNIKSVTGKREIYKNSFFSIEEKVYFGEELPYYTLLTPDYVTGIIENNDSKIILVRQYRHVIDDFALEFPSGHVDLNESPEEAIRREILEETGYLANNLKTAGVLVPDIGRLGNKLFCFYSSDLEKSLNFEPELGVEVLEFSKSELKLLISEGQFFHALNLAALHLCINKGFLDF